MNVAERNTQVYYNQLFDKEIVDLFNNNQILESLAVTSDEFSINIDKIIQSLDIQIIEEFMEYDCSGRIDIPNRKMYINKNHSENRKRFTKAHELAHYLYKHKGTNHRTQDINSYTDVKDFENERKANTVAANILMPRMQVEALYEMFLSDNNLDFGSPLNSSQKDELYNIMSDKLFVSKSAVSYRLMNLGIL
ncbi:MULTISPECIES: ImmA/IrrE family metallo-endopeptidase [Staphylococcus]|uniref:ImmA/IrrE family metallo-endopeptidase n=1 Tax=Staphylococcus TaxID=1279 RepID=UPI001E2B3F18|nr:ImmA/IrrE family metallo-endopeptidase [Staphylococcus arlettae]MCD8906962.1 ImmA/IrrE family metallo-endopeptidase [Staphylococcus arlettae]UXU49133.1 ImmA/IrrE family metallo-endopeptidase [Staphylococcus arlettae]